MRSDRSVWVLVGILWAINGLLLLGLLVPGGASTAPTTTSTTRITADPSISYLIPATPEEAP